MAPYSTTFAANENPLSEGGAWLQHNVNKAKVVTTGGNAFGTGANVDGYAYLPGFGDSVIETTVFRDATLSDTEPNTYEVEHLHRLTDDAGNTSCYEVDFPYYAGTNVLIVRWFGGSGFNVLNGLVVDQSFPNQLRDGYKIKTEIPPTKDRINIYMDTGSGYVLYLHYVFGTDAVNDNPPLLTGDPAISFFTTISSSNLLGFKDVLVTQTAVVVDGAVSSFTWKAADAVGTLYALEFGFKPGAMLLFCTGVASPTSAVSGALDGYRSFGVAADDNGTLVRWAVGTSDDDAAATTDCGKIKRNDACLALPNFAGGAATGLLDISSVNATQGVFISDQAPPVDLRVIVLALPAADVAGVDAGEFDLGALSALGQLDVNLGGGKPWVPSCVIVAHIVKEVAGNNVSTTAQIGIGVMNVAGEQGMISCLSRDALATADTWGYCNDLELLATLDGGSGATMQRARGVGMRPGGFTINRLQHDVFGNTKYPYLALAGIPVSIKGLLQPGTLGNKVTHEVPFLPRAAMCISANRAKDAQAVPSANDVMNVGFAAAPTSRVAQGYLSEDATAGSEVDMAIQTDAVLASVTAAAAIDGLMDVDEMSRGKVVYVTDDAPAVAAFFLSVVFGTNEKSSSGVPRWPSRLG